MRIFVTGASGWIGSSVVPELTGAGHQVLGLARADASAEAVAGMGAEVLRGDLNDTDVLRAEEFAGLLVPLLTRDMPASSAITQELLGWKPTHPGLIEDIEQGHYFS